MGVAAAKSDTHLLQRCQMRFRSGCSGTALPFVNWLRLCWVFLYLAPAGAPPVWGKADGLLPAELVGSTSDSPSCRADVIPMP